MKDNLNVLEFKISVSSPPAEFSPWWNNKMKIYTLSAIPVTENSVYNLTLPICLYTPHYQSYKRAMLQMAPYCLCSALILRETYTVLGKVVDYVWNGVPFGMCQAEGLSISLYVLCPLRDVSVQSGVTFTHGCSWAHTLSLTHHSPSVSLSFIYLPLSLSFHPSFSPYPSVSLLSVP